MCPWCILSMASIHPFSNGNCKPIQTWPPYIFHRFRDERFWWNDYARLVSKRFNNSIIVFSFIECWLSMHTFMIFWLHRWVIIDHRPSMQGIRAKKHASTVALLQRRWRYELLGGYISTRHSYDRSIPDLERVVRKSIVHVKIIAAPRNGKHQ